MCSRYSLTEPSDAVSKLFRCGSVEPYPPRYNIAPTEPILIVRHSLKAEREAVLVRWGLIPSWTKDPAGFSTLINARCETITGKPSFRASVRHRRCLIPADGFYEWTGAKGHKLPHRISHNTRKLIAFTGIWETWLGGDGSEIDTAAIITTEANQDMRHLHDRMPLILESKDFERWLDCSSGSVEPVRVLLGPTLSGRLTTSPVSRRVNNPHADGPDLWQPDDGDARLL